MNLGSRPPTTVLVCGVALTSFSLLHGASCVIRWRGKEKKKKQTNKQRKITF